VGFCAFLEDPGGILCIFGSSSSDFVNFWKFLMEFCEFLEVPHVILSIFGRNFQICTNSHEELPKMHKIP
jgi:hypothetical protein